MRDSGKGLIPAWRSLFVTAFLSLALLASAAAPEEVRAQDIQGRVTDTENGVPVGLAAIFLLDAERDLVARSSTDLDGRYSITVPAAGEYYVVIERLGYFENESPLLSIASSGVFGVDVELRPEPFRLDPLEVTVQNEELEDFLRLEFGVHPATVRGYRVIQGIRLAEVKLKAVDNTDLLRRLYIPVSHGITVCINSFGPGAELPERMSHDRVMAASNPTQTQAPCGALYVDGYRCQNAFIEEIDMDRIGVVVVVDGAVRLYTRDFDWTFRPGGGALAC